MQFLKTLFWVFLAVIFVIFAANNWTSISIQLWSDLWLRAKLPVLLVTMFVIGFLPPFFIYKTANWRLKRRVAVLEAANQPVILDPVDQPVRPDGIL